MSFRRMQWLFPLAVTLHNAEEAIFLPSWVFHHSAQLPLHPPATAIRAGLLFLTLAAFAVTALSARGGKQAVWTYLLFGYASAMLINIFVPHIPATVIFRGYTPGVVTAVLVNLPVMSVLLALAFRDQWVSGWKAFVFALLVPLGIAGSILLWFTVG